MSKDYANPISLEPRSRPFYLLRLLPVPTTFRFDLPPRRSRFASGGFFVALTLALSGQHRFAAAPHPAAARFEMALPGYRFQFPRDHGSHPAYQTEWWYYTGHLRAQDGHRFGYQLTFFRTALTPQALSRRSKWATRDLIFAHFALCDADNHRFYFDDRLERAAAGLAGADAASSHHVPHIWLHDWDLKFGGARGQSQKLRADGTQKTKSETAKFALDLTQVARKNPVAHGRNGASQKSSGADHASHYYSFTRLQTRGALRLNGQKYFVSGESWFDHEFGSSQLAPNQIGWDWFSLQLDDGRELMLYQLRLKNGAIDPFSSGTLIEADGGSRHLARDEFSILPRDKWRSPHSRGVYPARWSVRLPRENLALDIAPAVSDQELNTRRSTGISYWEGLVDCRGTQGRRTLRGRGYVELTGYAKPFQSTF